MVGGPETMTKRYPQQWSRALVTRDDIKWTSMCTNTALNKTQTTKHNETVWEIHKLLLPLHNKKHALDELIHSIGAPPSPENTIPMWLHPCLCTTIPCHCLAKLIHDTLIVVTTSPQKTTHYNTKKWSLQFIEFMVCRECDPITTTKKLNYQPLPDTLEDVI